MYESEVKSEVNTIFFCFGHSVLRQWCSRTLHKSSWLCFSAGLPGRKWWTQTCVHGLPGKKGGKKQKRKFLLNIQLIINSILKSYFFVFFTGETDCGRVLKWVIDICLSQEDISTTNSPQHPLKGGHPFPANYPCNKPATSIKGEGITSASSNSRHLNNETHIQEYQTFELLQNI